MWKSCVSSELLELWCHRKSMSGPCTDPQPHKGTNPETRSSCLRGSPGATGSWQIRGMTRRNSPALGLLRASMSFCGLGRLWRGMAGSGARWLGGRLPGSQQPPHLRRFQTGWQCLEVFIAKMMLGTRKKAQQPRQNQKAFWDNMGGGADGAGWPLLPTALHPSTPLSQGGTSGVLRAEGRAGERAWGHLASPHALLTSTTQESR